MAQKLQITIEIDGAKADSFIKSFNQSLGTIDRTAVTATKNAGNGFKDMENSMTGPIVKSALIVQALNQVLEVTKALITSSVELSGRNEVLSLSLTALAHANNLNAQSVQGVAKSLEKQGLSTVQAKEITAKMIVTTLDLRKANELVGVAQNIAALNNLTVSESAKKLADAIEGLRVKQLKNLGLTVDLHDAYTTYALDHNKLAKNLGVTEHVQALLNAVIQRGGRFNGEAAAAANTYEVQLNKLKTEFESLKTELGDAFLPVAKDIVQFFRDGVEAAKEHKTAVIRVTEAMIGLGSALVTYKIAAALFEMAKGLRAVFAAVSGSPVGLALVGIGGIVSGAAYLQKKIDESHIGKNDKAIQRALLPGVIGAIIPGAGLISGATNPYFEGYFDAGGRSSGKKPGFVGPIDPANPDRYTGAVGTKGFATGLDNTAGPISQEDADKRRAAAAANVDHARKLIIESRIAAQNQLAQAETKEYEGALKVVAEGKKELENLSTKRNLQGDIIHLQLDENTLATINLTTHVLLVAEIKKTVEERRKFDQERAKALEGYQKKYSDAEFKRYEDDVKFAHDTESIRDDATERSLNYQSTLVEHQRNAQLEALSLIQAKTLDQQLILIGKKTNIELAYQKKSEELEIQKAQRQNQKEIDDFEFTEKLKLETEVRATQERFQLFVDEEKAKNAAQVARGKLSYEEEAKSNAKLQEIADKQYIDAANQRILGEYRINDRKLAIAEKLDGQLTELTTNGESERGDIVAKAAKEQVDVLRTHYVAIFDSIKSASSSLFDQLFSKSKSFLENLGNVFKTLFLTILKEIVTSQIAAQFTHLLTGANVSFQGGPFQGTKAAGLGGILGRLGSGGVPVISGGGLPGFGGGTSSTGQPTSRIISNGAGGVIAVPTQVISANGTQAIQGGGVYSGSPTPVTNTNGGGGGFLPIFGGGSITGGPGGTGGFAGPVSYGGTSTSAPFGNPLSFGIPPFFGGGNQTAGSTTISLPGGGSASVPNSVLNSGPQGPGAGSAVLGQVGGLGSIFGKLGGFGGKYGSQLNAAGLGLGLGFAAKGFSTAEAYGAKGTIDRIGGAGLAGFSALGKLGTNGSFLGLTAHGGTAGAIGLGAGIGLAADGLKRGGVVGLAEDTAGGALIGARFGGAEGAAIGAGIGALVGLARLFIKGFNQQVREAIKSAYGIDIKDGKIIAQIADTIKSHYGGNIQVGIRSKEILELLNLYAQTTGQKFPIANKPRPLFLNDVGGTLYQTPFSQNGQTIAYAGLPTLTPADRIVSTGTGYTNNTNAVVGNGDRSGGPTFLTFNLEGDSAMNALKGQTVGVINDNPGAISDATLRSNAASYNRRQNAASAIAPGTIVTS